MSARDLPAIRVFTPRSCAGWEFFFLSNRFRGHIHAGGAAAPSEGVVHSYGSVPKWLNGLVQACQHFLLLNLFRMTSTCLAAVRKVKAAATRTWGSADPLQRHAGSRCVRDQHLLLATLLLAGQSGASDDMWRLSQFFSPATDGANVHKLPPNTPSGGREAHARTLFQPADLASSILLMCGGHTSATCWTAPERSVILPPRV